MICFCLLRIWVAKPSESSVQKFVGGCGATAGPLSVEGPAKNKLRRAIIFSRHPLEPMVDEGGLPDPSPGNDCNDVGVLVCPGIVQKSDILLSTENIASGNGQSGN